MSSGGLCICGLSGSLTSTISPKTPGAGDVI